VIENDNAKAITTTKKGLCSPSFISTQTRLKEKITNRCEAGPTLEGCISNKEERKASFTILW